MPENILCGFSIICFLISIIIINCNEINSFIDNGIIQLESECLYKPEGKTAEIIFGKEYKISFLLSVNWSTTPFSSDNLTITLDPSDFKLVLGPQQPNDKFADAKILRLDATQWHLGWNNITLTTSMTGSVNNTHNEYYISLMDNYNTTMFNELLVSRELKNMKVEGYFSLINCSSDFRYYNVTSNLVLPMELTDNYLEIFIVSNMSEKYFVAFDKNNDAILLCPNSSKGDSSKCNNSFAFESNKVYTYDIYPLLSKDKNFFQCQGYAQTLFSFHGLNNASFVVKTQISTSEVYDNDCSPNPTSDMKKVNGNQLMYHDICYKIWVTSGIGVFTMLFGLTAIYLYSRNSIAKANHKSTIAHWRKLEAESHGNIGDEASLTKQEGSKEDYDEYEIKNSCYVSFENRISGEALPDQPTSTYVEEDLDEYESPENIYEAEKETQ